MGEKEEYHVFLYTKIHDIGKCGDIKKGLRYFTMGSLNKKKFKKAIDGSSGILTVIADRCGVTRQAVYNYLERFPEFKVDIAEEKEKLLDRAEEGLSELVDQQREGAIKFTLTRLGKHRGYGEVTRVESTGPNGDPIHVINELKIPVKGMNKEFLEKLAMNMIDLDKD